MVDAINNQLLKLCNKLPDWENKYPSNDERYDAMIKFMYISFFFGALTLFLSGAAEPDVYIERGRRVVEEPSTFILLCLGVSTLACIGVTIYSFLLNIYIAVKSGLIKFLLQLVLNIVLGCIAMAIISAILGPIGAIIGIVVAIGANRKRLAILKKYKRYLYTIIALCIIPGLLGAISGILSYLLKSSDSTLLALVAIVVSILTVASPMLITRNLLRTQQKNGVAFLDTMRIFQAIPFVMFCCLLSFLTLIHVTGISGDSVFGDSGSDFLAGDPNGGISGEGHAEAASIDSSIGQHSTGFVHNSVGAENAVNVHGSHISNNGNIGVEPVSMDGAVTSNVQVHSSSIGAENVAVPHNDTTTYQISDENMNLQGSVALDSNGDGTIQNSYGFKTGTVSHDALHNTVVSDNAGNKVGSVDTTGFIHDATDKPTAQVLSSGHGVDTVIDTKTGEITLNNNGFVTNQDGVVGNIKKS